MKNYRYLLLAFLVLSAKTYALQPNIEIYEQFDNLRMVALLNKDDVLDSPKWNPNQGEPPMSVADAIQAVRGYLNDTTKSTVVREIEIRPIPHYEAHWHYLIKVANDAKQSKFDIYVILMDGKIIPANIRPK